MHFTDIFVKRPVLATVVSLLILIVIRFHVIVFGFGVVAKQPLAQLNVAVVNGREAVDDDVANARGVLDVQAARERQEVSIAHVASCNGFGYATDALEFFRVDSFYDGLCFKTEF